MFKRYARKQPDEFICIKELYGRSLKFIIKIKEHLDLIECSYFKKGKIMIFFTIWILLIGTLGVFYIIISKERKYLNLIAILIYFPFIGIPIFLIQNIYKDTGIIFLILSIVIGYIIIIIGTEIYNRIKISIAKDEGIYIRDMEVDYSPAILSYLENQRTEPKKDIIASILDLCAKKYLYIEKQNENKYILKLGKNMKIDNLKSDEKYLYEKLSKGEKINIDRWIKLVQEEFKKYKFVRKNKINLYSVFLILYFAIIIGISIIIQINPNFKIANENFNIIFITFFVAFELAFIEPIMRIIIKYLRKGEYFSGIYTASGIKEMRRWKAYKDFLKDYTLIKDKPIESVVILEKHIAYAIVLDVNKKYTNNIIEDLNLNYSLNFDYIKEIINDIGE